MATNTRSGFIVFLRQLKCNENRINLREVNCICCSELSDKYNSLAVTESGKNNTLLTFMTHVKKK